MAPREASRKAIKNLKRAAADGGWEDSAEDESDAAFVHSRTASPSSSVGQAAGALAADNEAADALI
eukprot:5471268-Prymnesium_polylepis.1